ncbi:MAG: acyl-CoA dehydrogenase [Alphaproteobacteria bacterium]|nr:acyl-CoA dehydrogenase [Alphaproteobacteria bacterium]
MSRAQRELQERARALARGEIAARAAETDRSETYPCENVRALVRERLVGLTIPRAYGGHGLGYLDAVLVIDEMAQACGVTGRIAVETNMGAIGAIMAYGTEPQKRLTANLVLAGDKPAICITEPQAGSAATEMTTRADRQGDHYVLSGKKHWITGGGVSRLHLVFARVFDERGEQDGIDGFLVVRDQADGPIVGWREATLGLRGLPETEILFAQVAVAESMRLPSPRGTAKGFADPMDAYNGQRVGAATVALGLGQGAFDLARDYAFEREQLGRPIGEFQGLQWMLADMHLKTTLARTMIYRAATGGGVFPDPTDAAVAKIYAAEMAIEVTNAALQIFGARGYSRDCAVERMLRDARMFTIGGGTVQVLRNFIAGKILGRSLPQTRDGYMNEPLTRARR